MKPYFAYIRVSTVKQGEEGSSLAEQRAAIEVFAARHDITIVQWFEEVETAAKRGRPQFNQLTNLLRAGKARGVVLHKIDRGARNLKDWADLGDLIDAGVEVLFAHEGLDMTTRGGRLAADIQAVVAADYIRNLRDEVRKGFYGRLKQGLYPLPAPRGYCDNGKGRPKTIDPVSGPLVRHAFERYATGTVSLEVLRNELAAAGMKSACGTPLSRDALSGMLHNPFYTGLIRILRTGEVFEGVHEPLVSKATFDRVQVIMKGRLYPRIQKHKHLFRRLIRCAACGRSLTAETQKGHVYYRCHDRGCRGVSHKEEVVNDFILNELSKIALSPEDLVDLRDILQELIRSELTDASAKVEHTERELALTEQRLERLTDALLDGTIDRTTYANKKSVLVERMRELRSRQVEGTQLTFWKLVAERFELGISAQRCYISGNSDEKREALAIFGSNLLAKGKSLEFPMYFPFDEMRKASNLERGGSHQAAVRTRSPKRLAQMIRAIAHHEHHDHVVDTVCTVSRARPRSPKVPPRDRTDYKLGALTAARKRFEQPRISLNRTAT
jgi:site-specific DNA recombinase